MGKVVCVGGGTGVAVLHPITRALKQIGNDVTCIIGARTKDLLILESQMQAASNDLRVCTDDGTYGHHGFVTDVLKELLEGGDVKLVVGIGPVPMMRAVSQPHSPLSGENHGKPEPHHDRRYGDVWWVPGNRWR